MESCRTLDALSAYWKSLIDATRADSKVLEMKDHMKAQLAGAVADSATDDEIMY